MDALVAQVELVLGLRSSHEGWRQAEQAQAATSSSSKPPAAGTSSCLTTGADYSARRRGKLFAAWRPLPRLTCPLLLGRIGALLTAVCR